MQSALPAGGWQQQTKQYSNIAGPGSGREGGTQTTNISEGRGHAHCILHHTAVRMQPGPLYSASL